MARTRMHWQYMRINGEETTLYSFTTFIGHSRFSVKITGPDKKEVLYKGIITGFPAHYEAARQGYEIVKNQKENDMEYNVQVVKPEPTFVPIKVEIVLRTLDEAQEFEARMALYNPQINSAIRESANVLSCVKNNSVLSGITGLRRRIANLLCSNSINGDFNK